MAKFQKKFDIMKVDEKILEKCFYKSFKSHEMK